MLVFKLIKLTVLLSLVLSLSSCANKNGSQNLELQNASKLVFNSFNEKDKAEITNNKAEVDRIIITNDNYKGYFVNSKYIGKTVFLVTFHSKDLVSGDFIKIVYQDKIIGQVARN
ncbi:MAG: hypothetical protein ACI31W_07430 [Lactococcus sp.]